MILNHQIQHVASGISRDDLDGSPPLTTGPLERLGNSPQYELKADRELNDEEDFEAFEAFESLAQGRPGAR